MKGSDPGGGSNARPQGGALLAAGGPEAEMGAAAAGRFPQHTERETRPYAWAYAGPPRPAARCGTHVVAQVSQVSSRPKCPLLPRGFEGATQPAGSYWSEAGICPALRLPLLASRRGLEILWQTPTDRKETLPCAESQVRLCERGPTSLSFTHRPTRVYAVDIAVSTAMYE